MNRLLLVEDDPLVRKTCKRIMKVTHEIDEAGTVIALQAGEGTVVHGGVQNRTRRGA